MDAALLSELVAVAFSQRRKLLRHTLEPGCKRAPTAARLTCAAALKKSP